MKAIKITAIIISAVLLFVLICFLFFKPLYYRIFYPWNRITGTIGITIDGEKYDLKDGDVSGSHENADVGIGFKKSGSGAKVSIRGGDYGPYTLMTNVEGLDKPLEVVIFQYNWWNVAEFDLSVAIDRAADNITFTSSAQVLNEDGKKVTEDNSASLKKKKKKIVYYIVSV